MLTLPKMDARGATDMSEKEQALDVELSDEEKHAQYEKINAEARQNLIALACNMQFLLKPADVAHNFLGAGLSVLLALPDGEDVTRRWLQKVLEGLDDNPARVH